MIFLTSVATSDKDSLRCIGSSHHLTYLSNTTFDINTLAMAGTRSSARQAAAAANSSFSSSQKPPAANNASAGSKRKGSTTTNSKSKRGKKGDEKEQATIEETMPIESKEDDPKDVEMKDDVESAKPDVEEAGKEKASEENVEGESAKEEEVIEEQEQPPKDDQMDTQDAKPTNGYAQDKGVDKPNGVETIQNEDTSKMDETGAVDPADATANEGKDATSKPSDAVEQSPKREESTPSSILEKGLIYFFFRGRVGIHEPSDVNDIARSYIVLRPLPHGAKLGDGVVSDAGNNRLLALPKKVLPVSAKDRFMVFVDKANANIEEIKKDLSSSDYMTKTVGSRHTPAAAPIGEGVYAITTTGRESHLSYILTIPSELNEVQQEVGLKARGSFVTSVKNPQFPGPANTNLPKGPDYPQE